MPSRYENFVSALSSVYALFCVQMLVWGLLFFYRHKQQARGHGSAPEADPSASLSLSRSLSLSLSLSLACSLDALKYLTRPRSTSRAISGAISSDAISREPAKAESCRARRRQTLWSGGFSAVRPPRRPHAMQSSSATAASVPPVPSWLRSCAGGRRLPDCSSAQHSKRGSRQ